MTPTGAFTLNLSLLASSYLLHLVATVIWLGGMALQVLVIFPVQRGNPEWQPMLDAITRRFRPLANFCLVVLLVTGVVQTSEDDHYGGILNFETDWSQAILGKHIAFLLMVGIVVFMQVGLYPALERAGLLAAKGKAIDDLSRLRYRERRLTQANFILSLVVLFFTAVATAL